jgi:hypothetical protein
MIDSSNLCSPEETRAYMDLSPCLRRYHVILSRQGALQARLASHLHRGPRAWATPMGLLAKLHPSLYSHISAAAICHVMHCCTPGNSTWCIRTSSQARDAHTRRLILFGTDRHVWIDCHVHMSGFRTDLSSYHMVVAMHT